MCVDVRNYKNGLFYKKYIFKSRGGKKEWWREEDINKPDMHGFCHNIGF